MIKRLFKKVFFEWEWICAYRTISNEEKTNLPYNQAFQYRSFTMPKGCWAADPFLFEHNGSVDLFFEFMVSKKRKAVLGHKNINDEKNEKIDIIYEFEGHSSYPCIFEHKGEIYIIPETKANGQLVLLHCLNYPLVWETKSILLDITKVVDSTPFYYDGNLYIYLYEEEDGNPQNSFLSIGKLDVDKGSVSDIRSIISYSASTGRPAGHVLYLNNRIIRVTQPGLKRYGENISFYEMLLDEDGSYKEIECGRLEPEKITIDKNEKIVGIHTFNRSENYEVIDVLTEGHFSILRPLRFVFRKLGLFSYDDLDKKKTRLFEAIPCSYDKRGWR